MLQQAYSIGLTTAEGWHSNQSKYVLFLSMAYFAGATFECLGKLTFPNIQKVSAAKYANITQNIWFQFGSV